MTELQFKTAIASSPLISSCDIDAHNVLIRSYRKGQILDDHVAGAAMVGLVLEGIVEVLSVAFDGREISLSELKEGDCFGISDLIDLGLRTTVLKCRKASRILFIPKEELLARIQENPKIALEFIRLYNLKINFLIQRIESLTICSARRKLLEFLLSNQCKGTVSLDSNRTTLARRLGVSRAALYRELNYLSKGGLIAIDGKTLQLLDISRLEVLCNNAV